MVDIAEKAREAKLRWYGHVIRRDEGELGRDIMKLEIKSLPAWFLKSSSVVMI